jgi:hypothetical protein
VARSPGDGLPVVGDCYASVLDCRRHERAVEN